VIVTGRLRVREWATDEKSGINVEVDADSLGHDLTFGTSEFTRTPPATATPDTAESAAAAEEIPEGPEVPELSVDELAEQRAKHPSELPVPF
jgi:single-strand DNA-binding protein